MAGNEHSRALHVSAEGGKNSGLMQNDAKHALDERQHFAAETFCRILVVFTQLLHQVVKCLKTQASITVKNACTMIKMFKQHCHSQGGIGFNTFGIETRVA